MSKIYISNTFNYLGLILIIVFTLSLLITGCGSEDAEIAPPAAPKTSASEVDLKQVTLTAFPVKTWGTSKLTLIKGNEQHFHAMGEDANGRSTILREDINDRVWRTSDNTMAEFIQPGVLTGKVAGDITVYVATDDIISNEVGLRISDADITAISVTPSILRVAKGQSEPLSAIATYTNGISADISDSVKWTIADPSTVTVSPEGQITGLGVGTTSITAVKDNVTSNTLDVTVTSAMLKGISVTPTSLTVAKWQSEPLTATAIYSDGTTSNISDFVVWKSTDTNTANVTSRGLLSGDNVGTTTITAAKDGLISNAIDVAVTSAMLTGISVTPTSLTVAKWASEPLTATATYSDGTTSNISDFVVWKSTDTSTATVTPEGDLMTTEVGTTTITAVKDNVTSNAIDVDVTNAVLTAINVKPSNVTVAKGHSEPLTAIATYSDGNSSDISDSVTWIPVDTHTATVSHEGRVNGGNIGVTTITAAKDGVISNAIDINVTTAVMTGLTLNPPAVGLMINSTQPMKATAIYSDGTSSDVSDSVTWRAPVGDSIISVTADGLVTGVNEGNTNITAHHNDGFTHSVDINVCSGNGTNVTGKCIYTTEGSDGNLFTSTPSIAYLDSLGFGGSLHTSSTNGMFYTFNHPKATALCTKFNAINLVGRSNWRLPTVDEKISLYQFYIPRIWNHDTSYWTSTTGKNEGSWKAITYKDSYSTAYWGSRAGRHNSFYASCVSEP